ncbi:MAG TPA: histidine kinase, partial [Chitinophagaceae bacterium]|nr:histidine kinase [Chitinophagaceae bacterium]
MKRLPFILGLLTFFAVAAGNAQPSQTDSLRKALATAKDTGRVDCLNKLSYACLGLEDKDSAVYFTDLAYKEAKKINYIHGIAESFSLKSQIAKHFDDDFVQSESFGKESLRWYEMTPNKQGLENLYFYLFYTVFSQSKFEEALYYAEKEYELALQKGNQTGIFNSLSWIFAIYRQSGNYEKSFEYAQKAYELSQTAKNKLWISSSLYGIAQLYMLIEDYPEALNYFHRVLQMDDDDTRRDRVNTDNDIWFKMEFTEVFSHLHQFDSAAYYYNLFRPSKDKKVYLRVYWISTGENYFLQNDYVHAMQNFQLGLAEHKKLNDRNEIMRSLLDIGKTFLALDNNTEALRCGKEGLDIALQSKTRQFIRDGYHILYTTYDRLHITDSANYYFRQYVTMRDTVLTDQVKGKFAAYNYEQKIALINKEEQVQQARLEKASIVKKMLLVGIASLCLLSFVVMRNLNLKRKNEKQKLEYALELQQAEAEKTKSKLQQQATELEMQALRAQMSPHFIFNSLNSINLFILENNRLKASEYLSKFSRLIRLILQNSQETLIPLENELEALQLYLELEALRFDNKFAYTISV